MPKPTPLYQRQRRASITATRDDVRTCKNCARVHLPDYGTADGFCSPTCREINRSKRLAAQRVATFEPASTAPERSK